MDLKAVINDEALKKDEKGAIIYIKQLVKEFLNDPCIKSSFYLESFLSLFSSGDLYDIIKQGFKISEDEREHFYPLAHRCDADVRDFTRDLFKPDNRKGKENNSLIPLDIDIENKSRNENRDLLYDQFSPLKVTGLRFWEDSPNGLVVESRLIPTMGWQKRTASPPYKNLKPHKGGVTISSLQNSMYYFLQKVYIARDKKSRGYRLIVFHQGSLKLDRLYKTERGAKIGFGRIYNWKLWKKGLKPEWTPFYSPEESWQETLSA